MLCCQPTLGLLWVPGRAAECNPLLPRAILRTVYSTHNTLETSGPPQQREQAVRSRAAVGGACCVESDIHVSVNHNMMDDRESMGCVVLLHAPCSMLSIHAVPWCRGVPLLLHPGSQCLDAFKCRAAGGVINPQRQRRAGRQPAAATAAAGRPGENEVEEGREGTERVLQRQDSSSRRQQQRQGPRAGMWCPLLGSV